MAFNKPLPDWHAQGVEPPQSLRNAGWGVGQKPPADYFNWIQFRTYEALKELQEKAGEIKTINGQSPDASGNIDVDTSEIEQEIANLEGYIGNLTELTTEQKESLVAAINEVKQNIVDNSSDIAGLQQELTSHKTDIATHLTDFTKLRINFMDVAIELETLKSAELTGVDANIFIETFQNLDDVVLERGGYNSTNKRLEV